jgi:hypothetical protein
MIGGRVFQMHGARLLRLLLTATCHLIVPYFQVATLEEGVAVRKETNWNNLLAWLPLDQLALADT